jgi:hypothetical protein
MAQITGIVKLYLNGNLQRSREGAKLDMGGKERTVHTGYAVYGYSEKVVPSTVTFDLAHTADIDLPEIDSLTSARVRFECDTGITYLITNAFTVKPCSLKDGMVAVEMQGEPAEPE